MKTGTILALIIVILVVIGGAFLFAHRAAAPSTAEQATSTPSAATGQTVTSPQGVSFSYADPYALATTPEQVTAKAYIPPCAQGFDYCLFRTGTEYANTNFESAGLSVRARADLKTQASCLSTQPEGYTGLHATTSTASTYATSVFGPIGDAAAGHYSSGAAYRLWTGSSCEEFQTRIGETQFANYPAGTKTEFTAADRAKVMNELTAMLNRITLNGTSVSFPQP